MLAEQFEVAGRVVAVAALAAIAGLLVVNTGDVAVAGGAILTAFIIIVSWPRQSGAFTASGVREITLITVLIAYLLPLLMLGRAFAVLGSSPIYVADVLIAVASLLMLPKLRLSLITPLPLLCVLIALLALHAVYIGQQHGYPAATKGLVLALYPLVAISVAGWVAGLESADGALSVLSRRILPLVTVGLVIVLAANASNIPASYGLYLGIAAAFAIVPGIPRRGLLGLSCLVGFVLIIAFDAERGPTLTVLLAALASWLAASRFRPRTSGPVAMVAVLIVITGTALVFSLEITPSPERIPVVGRLIARTTATSSSDSSATNNVTLRTTAWSYALSTTYRQDPLFGIGAYHPIEVNFKGNDLAVDPATGVHNSFVGYVFYAGYPAGLLVVFVFALGLWRIWRIRHLTVYAPALLGALVAAVVTALTNVALETTYIGGPSWLVLAAAVGLAGRYSTKCGSDLPSAAR